YRLNVIVPVGLTPPVRWATSLTEPPIVIVPDGVVVNPGPALFTVELSPESLQLPSTARLFSSPEDWAIQRYLSTAAEVKLPELSLPAPLTVAEVTAGVSAALYYTTLFRTYRLNVIAPVGLTPPVRWATSLTEPPIVIVPDGVVVNPGPALFTVELSPESLQLPSTALLFASSEEQAFQRYVRSAAEWKLPEL